MVPRMARVVRRRTESHDTFTLWLDSRGAFAPGQFNMLYVFGAGEVPISISGDPEKPGELMHTIRAVGPVTRALARLKKGDAVGVRGPFGSAWPVNDALGKDLLIVAGGIGLAPLRSVLCFARKRQKKLGKVCLAYGARSPADLLYARELGRLAERFDVAVTVDRGDPGWTGHTGVVTKLLGGFGLEPERSVVFACGPEIMMRFVARELANLGVPPNALWVSLERNMKCAVALCGHCQLGTELLCRDGPVRRWDKVRPLLEVKEL